MRQRTIVLAGVIVLGLGSSAYAQLPRSGNGMTFVPIDTTRNLATPIPSVNVPQSQPSFFDQLYEKLAKILPFTPKSKRNPLSAPMAPVMQLPQPVQSQLPPPQQPRTTLPTNLPQLPTGGGS